ncbi:MAG: hypothetical protein JWN70_2728 [Planctomycetaceae bacterium]|nr:hypothetical protein [Planctomycetaceae bacterium]
MVGDNTAINIEPGRKQDTLSLTAIENSILLATYFRGESLDTAIWISNTDQIITLSLFYTGDISFADCAARLSIRSYVQNLYDDNGNLTAEIDSRYTVLINLLHQHPELLEGAGDFQLPAFPTYTSLRLTEHGLRLALDLINSFPAKPDFLDWPDQREIPGSV